MLAAIAAARIRRRGRRRADAIDATHPDDRGLEAIRIVGVADLAGISSPFAFAGLVVFIAASRGNDDEAQKKNEKKEGNALHAPVWRHAGAIMKSVRECRMVSEGRMQARRAYPAP